MTTIFTVLLEAVSDNLLLAAIVIVVNILCSDSDKDIFSTRKRSIAAAILISGLISIVFNQKFFDQIAFFKWFLIFINFLKYILLSACIFKKLSAKLVITALTVQFLCSNITSALLALFSFDEVNKLYVSDIILHFFVRLIVLFTALYISRKDNREGIQDLVSIIPPYTFVLIILSMSLSDGLIQTANFNTSKISTQIYMIKIFASFITIFMTIILLTLLFSAVSEKYQSDVNNALKKQIESQLYHYKELEKINTEIKCFKHDYINHIKCIRSMLSNKEYDDLLKYFNKLSDSFPSASFLFETGNYIADAILTEKQSNFPDGVSIKFDGIIPTNIDNTDLCIILSNALDNAAEACSSLSGDKIISVYGAQKHGYFILKIKNPTVNTFVNGRIMTTKPDKENHGFGLRNIKRTVKKYNGYVGISCEDNVFTLNITFSNMPSARG